MKRRTKPNQKRLKNKSILHLVTGSIAAVRAGDILQALREQGAETTCVMTESAKKFVTPLVLRAFSGKPVYHDFFSAETSHDVLHTSLADASDAILVAPASADFIARLAAGLADDLASCIILAARCPVVITPAMNDHMYAHPLTQQNIRKLKQIGYHFVEPVQGHLVCGKEAVGHISDIPTIVHALEKTL